MALRMLTVLFASAMTAAALTRKRAFLQAEELQLSDDDSEWDAVYKKAGLPSTTTHETTTASTTTSTTTTTTAKTTTMAKTVPKMAPKKAVMAQAQAHTAATPAKRRLKQDERAVASKNQKQQLKAQSKVIDQLHSQLSKVNQAVSAINVSALKRELMATKSDLAQQTRLLNEANEKNWLIEKDYKAKLVEEQAKSVKAEAAKAKAEAALQSESAVMQHLTEEDSRAQREASSLHAELDHEKAQDESAEKELNKQKATVKELESAETKEQQQSKREEAGLHSELAKQTKLYSELKVVFDKTNATLIAVEQTDGKEIKNLTDEATRLNKTLAKQRRKYAELRHNDTRDAAQISASIASNVSTMQRDFQKQLDEESEAMKQLRAKGVKAIKALQGRLAVEGDRVSAAEKEEERLRMELAEKSKANLDQNQSRIVLEQGLRDQLEAEKATIAASSEQASEALSIRTQERDEAKGELQKVGHEEVELRQELANAQKALNELKANVTRDSHHILPAWLR